MERRIYWNNCLKRWNQK